MLENAKKFWMVLILLIQNLRDIVNITLYNFIGNAQVVNDVHDCHKANKLAEFFFYCVC